MSHPLPSFCLVTHAPECRTHLTVVDLTAVPEVYHDIGGVFSKQRACTPPPYDCAIDLLPGAALASSRLYSISRPEREAMERYLSESLAVGLRPAKCVPPHLGLAGGRVEDGI